MCSGVNGLNNLNAGQWTLLIHSLNWLSKIALLTVIIYVCKQVCLQFCLFWLWVTPMVLKVCEPWVAGAFFLGSSELLQINYNFPFFACRLGLLVQIITQKVLFCKVLLFKFDTGSLGGKSGLGKKLQIEKVTGQSLMLPNNSLKQSRKLFEHLVETRRFWD